MFKWKKKSISGFTLIEILVVLVIISIITAVAVIAFGDFGRGRREKVMAELLQRTIPIAQQQAILQPAILGMSITGQGYQFYQYWIDPKTKMGAWRRLPEDVLSRQNAFSNITIKLELLEKAPDIIGKNKQPNILFLPNGFVTPFKLFLSGEGKNTYELQIQPDGTVTLKTNS